MKTLHTELFNKKDGQDSTRPYKVQLNLNPALKDRAMKAKFQLEMHEGSSISWTLFFFRCLDVMVAELNKRPVPKLDRLK